MTLTIEKARNLLHPLQVEGEPYPETRGASKILGTSPQFEVRDRLRVFGYAKGIGSDLSHTLAAHINFGMSRLVRVAKRHPILTFLADEPWLIFLQHNQVLASILGDDYRMLPAFWAWYVEGGSKGWPPHRDLGRGSVTMGGDPISLTMWIPLSAAVPPSSCMYVLPADRDPLYLTARENQPYNWEEHLQDICALPAVPGEFYVWNQALLHWGSAAAQGAPPRLSLATEFVRSRSNGSFSDTRPHELPSFVERCRLIAYQIRRYHHMSGMSSDERNELLDLLGE